MFFNQTESLDLKKYIKEQWVSISQLYTHLSHEETLLVKGHGFFNYDVNGQFPEKLGYYIIRINNRLFGFCGENNANKKAEDNPILYFKHITEFDISLLNSSLFEASQYSSTSDSYSKFEADLPVEAKIYLYEDEEKLLLSKKGHGNIDLYCSYQVKNKTNELHCKIYPAAFTAAKHLAMNKMLEQRIKDLKK